MYLEELYIADAYRRQGVGQLIMQAVFDVAGKHRCSRVEWKTDTGNTGVRGFYEAGGSPK